MLIIGVLILMKCVLASRLLDCWVYATFYLFFFLIYINDLHHCVKFCTTYHFADDTNLLNICKDYKTLQRQVNHDLFNLHKWLTANKISLNEGKTELIFFRKSGPGPNLNIKLHGKKLYSSKYLSSLAINVL